MTLDPLSEKYYSVSPYVYCANNPVRYIDPTGRELVDSKGRAMWANGKWTEFATSDAMRVGIAMRATETGLTQFNELVVSRAKIQIEISPAIKLNADGTMTRGYFESGKPTLDTNGNYGLTNGKIVVLEGSIKAEVNGKDNTSGEIGTLIKSLPKEVAIDVIIGSVGVHEGEHNSSENVRKRLVNKRNGKKSPPVYDTEEKPEEKQNQFLREWLNQFMSN